MPAVAQISFDDNDFTPTIGSRRDAATYTASPTIGTPMFNNLQALAAQQGANQVFDLTGYTYDPPDAITNFYEAFTPAGPGGNVAAYQGSTYVLSLPQAFNPGLPADAYGYYSVTPAGLYLHGNLAPGFNSVENVPPETIYEFPLTFGSNWVSTHTQTTAGVINSVFDVRITQTVDGWGMLQTPVGVFECLRIHIVREILDNGNVVATDTEIEFVTKDGLTARLGFDEGFQQWETVSYTEETITNDGDGGGGGGDGDKDVLLVIGDTGAPNSSDVAVNDLLVALGFTVMQMDDDAADPADATDKDLVVISSTSDPAVLTGDWSSVGVGLLTWEGELYDDLQMTGAVANTDFGITLATTTLTVMDSSHPIANGFAGEATVYQQAASMPWGVPHADAAIVAQDASAQATLFTYAIGATMVGRTAPARRVGFFLDDSGAANSTDDGLALLENALLWAAGCESEIDASVAVERRSDEVPHTVALAQNYPNPFNPTTVIPFEITQAGTVSLTVYNVLGQEVARLAEGVLSAGHYEATFDAASLPSGTYLYRLEAAGFTQVRAMLLTK